MGRIKGYYEWDDDSLTPGHKKEGGLHQNLYDTTGNLRGNARFVPTDGDEPVVVTETVFVPTYMREEDDGELGVIVAELVLVAMTIAKPHLERWFFEKAIPAAAQRRAKLQDRRTQRREAKQQKKREKQAAKAPREDRDVLNETTQEVSVAQPTMSRAEAQARYLAAIAAQAYAAEQLHLITTANLLNEATEDIRGTFAALPADQIQELVTRLAQDPSLLSEEHLAELASAMAHRTPQPRVETD